MITGLNKLFGKKPDTLETSNTQSRDYKDEFQEEIKLVDDLNQDAINDLVLNDNIFEPYPPVNNKEYIKGGNPHLINSRPRYRETFWL